MVANITNNRILGKAKTGSSAHNINISATKPTGQGTGLGLSLSYDIIKVHGGEIKVDTKEGEGSEFIICSPIK